MEFNQLPPSSKVYFTGLLILAGILALVSIWIPFESFLTVEFLIFLGLGCLTARLNIKMPLIDAHVSVDTGFVFAIFMLYGILPAVVAEIVTKFVFTYPRVTPQTRYRIAFNVASGVVSIVAAGYAYQTLLPLFASQSMAYLISILGLITAYYLVNTFSVALIISTISKVNVLITWWSDFAWTVIGFLASGSMATLLVFLKEDKIGIGIVMTIPIILMACFAFKLYHQTHESDSV